MAALGQTGAIDIIHIAGAYIGASLLLNAFEVQAPEDAPGPGVLPTPATASAPAGGNTGPGRLPMFDPATATPQQLTLAQQIMAGNLYAGADQLAGPLNAYLANPTIGGAVYNLNNSLGSARLSTAVKEVVNLSIGGLWCAEFPVATHSAAARPAVSPRKPSRRWPRAALDRVGGRRTDRRSVRAGTRHDPPGGQRPVPQRSSRVRTRRHRRSGPHGEHTVGCGNDAQSPADSGCQLCAGTLGRAPNWHRRAHTGPDIGPVRR